MTLYVQNFLLASDAGVKTGHSFIPDNATMNDGSFYLKMPGTGNPAVTEAPA